MTRILGLLSLIFIGFALMNVETSVSSQSGRVNNSKWVVNITNAANSTWNVNAKRTPTSTSSAGDSRRRIVEQMFADGIIDTTIEGMDNQPFTIDKLAKEITFRSVDLNGDGVTEFIVEGSFSMGVCGSSGCVSWIYERKGDTWRQIVAEPSNGSITVKKIKTNGYFNIQLATQSGAFDQFFHTLKFDGQKYRQSACIEHNYIDANGKLMKRPRISKC